MITVTYKGYIQELQDADGDVLGIGKTILGKDLYEELDLDRHTVSVRYWISDSKQSKDEMISGVLKSLYGVADLDYNHVYSETTGYLFTTEEFKVGGHDLIEELYSFIGKYAILEIDIHT